jgi:hypothetical protein
MYGNDWEYAGTRLDGTIVRLWSGNPIEVLRCHEDGVNIQDLVNDRVSTVDLGDLDLRPVPLGYARSSSHHNQLVYVCRKPMRRDWRQGLRKNNYVVLGNEDSVIARKDLAQCILGDHLSYEVAVESLKKGANEMLFHRHWKLNSIGEIHYKGLYVGRWSCQPELGDEFMWLREELMEVMCV